MREWCTIARNEATKDGDTSADVRIYGTIGDSWWGDSVTAKNVADQIEALDVDMLNVYVNSPGGAAWEGITIMNVLRRHKATVRVVIDGLAASAASVIAMAGDHIVMNRGSELMIHDAWGYAAGNESEMGRTSAALGKLSESIADVYRARAGGTRAGWRDLMRAETWYTADEAVEAGLADEWVDSDDGDAGVEAAAAARAAFDLSKFGYAYEGRAKAPAPVSVAAAARLDLPATEPGVGNRRKESGMTDNSDVLAQIGERLGLPEDELNTDAVLAAVDTLRAERNEPEAAAAALPEGATVIDAGVLAQLRADAAAGVVALAAQTSDRRDRIMAAALADGRVAPSSRDGWRAALDRDEEGTAALLETLPRNTVPVAELGVSGEVSEDDALAQAAWPTTKKEAQ